MSDSNLSPLLLTWWSLRRRRSDASIIAKVRRRELWISTAASRHFNIVPCAMTACCRITLDGVLVGRWSVIHPQTEEVIAGTTSFGFLSRDCSLKLFSFQRITFYCFLQPLLPLVTQTRGCKIGIPPLFSRSTMHAISLPSPTRVELMRTHQVPMRRFVDSILAQEKAPRGRGLELESTSSSYQV